MHKFNSFRTTTGKMFIHIGNLLEQMTTSNRHYFCWTEKLDGKNARSSRPEELYKKGVLKKFTEVKGPGTGVFL